jgi:hypothetical protein
VGAAAGGTGGTQWVIQEERERARANPLLLFSIVSSFLPEARRKRSDVICF